MFTQKFREVSEPPPDRLNPVPPNSEICPRISYGIAIVYDLG